MEEQVQIFIEKGKECVDAAGRKGLELVERARLSIKIGEAKAELRKDLLRLGKMAYEAIESKQYDFPNDMKAVANMISIDREHIEFLTEELSELCGTKICPQCGNKNCESAKYCNNCGTEI